MKLIDKILTRKFMTLLFDNIKAGKHPMEGKPDQLDRGNDAKLNAIRIDIEFTKEENKIFKKIKNVNYVSHEIATYFNMGDDGGNFFKPGVIKYFNTEGEKEKRFKAVIWMIQVKINIVDPNVKKSMQIKNAKPHNFTAAHLQFPKTDENEKPKEPTDEVQYKTTTQKYLNMNHYLIKFRDAMFDSYVRNEVDEDKETINNVIAALDVLSHYLDFYKEINGIKTKIKE